MRFGYELKPLIMLGVAKKISLSFLKHSEQILVPVRTTYIFRRINEHLLTTLEPASPQRLKAAHFIYEVEDTSNHKSPLVDFILIKDVPGIGMTGDKITMNSYFGYRDLIVTRLAVYPDSPEAKTVKKIQTEKQYSSMYSKVVENFFEDRALPILMSASNDWTLEPLHIKVALRQEGVFVKEDCVKLPKQQITGPNFEIENRDFIVKLIMNKSEEFPVRCRIYHNSNLKSSSSIQHMLSLESEPLFAHEKEEVIKLMQKEKDIKKLQEAKRGATMTKRKIRPPHKYDKKRRY